MDPFIKTIFIKHGVDGLRSIRKICDFIWFSKANILIFVLIMPINILTNVSLFLSFKELNYLKSIAKQIAITATSIQVLYKISLFYVEFHRILHMKKTIDEKFWDINNVEGQIRVKILKHFRLMRCILLVHLTAVLFGTLVLVSFPFIPYSDGRKKLPLHVWLPKSWDVNDQPIHEIFYFFLSFMVVSCIIVIVMYDFWFVYCAQHLYVQMELLKEKFANVANFPRIGNSEVLSSQKLQKIIVGRLQHCIEHHIVLIEFGKNLRKISTIVMLLQTPTTLFTLTFLGYAITKENKNSLDVYEMISFIASIMIQLFIYTFHGSELHYQSQTIQTSIGQSKWYLIRESVRKDIVFVLLNSQKYVEISAGGLLNINNELFVQILRSSFSCITLLLSQDK